MIENPRFQLRRTGKSTTIALETLKRAVDNPGLPVKVTDHYHLCPHQAAKNVACIVMDIVKALNLDVTLDRSG